MNPAQVRLSVTCLFFSPFLKQPGNKPRGIIPTIFSHKTLGALTKITLTPYWKWHKVSIVLIKGGGGQYKLRSLLQVHIPNRFKSIFGVKGIWGRGELWSEKAALLCESEGSRRDKTAIWLMREWRRLGEGGGMWSPKHLHCSCKQYWDS